MECSKKCQFYRLRNNRRYDELEEFCRKQRRVVCYPPDYDCKIGIEKQPTE